MIIIVTKKRKIRVDVQQFMFALFIIAGLIFMLYVGIDFVRFPEKYLTTWR